VCFGRMRADCLYIGKCLVLLLSRSFQINFKDSCYVFIHHTDCYLNNLATAKTKYSALFDRQAAIFLEHCGWVMDC
jgi:hypothetical protein